MTIVGDGDLKFELDPDWPRGMPEAWLFTLASDVAVDSRDRVFVFSRGRHPVTVWTPDGDFITSWGEGEFKDPHGIYIDASDNIWLTDTQRHVVTKNTQQGDILLELGTRDHAYPTTGPDGQNGLPFNMPSGVALNAEGDIFVSDGYGNRRVHRFSPDGDLQKSWGRGGKGPGEFALLHNIGIDERGRVFICDRENSRIQLFDQDGKYLEEWTDILNPGDVYMGPDHLVYVAEQGRPTGVSIFTLDGELLSRWRGPEAGMEAPHGIWGDSAGNVYVAEIGRPGHGQRVRKYVRR
ncbi:MAG: peptidyl-alpha-hydroxyglycine alpha-amidating lyase family protein [Chloroflexota bacterium]